MTWNNDITPHSPAHKSLPKTSEKSASGNIRNRWSRHNHWFKPIKTNRYNTLNTNLMDMNKINAIQPVPKRACECSSDTHSYCKYEAPHPSPIHLD